MTEQIQAQVERISFTNEETGYCVIKARLSGRKDSVNIVGNFVSVCPGEMLKLEGTWEHHPQYGQQFRVLNYETIIPANKEGITKYLASGLIRGIGPVMAKRIVDRFGERTLDIIDEDPELLKEVEGIGENRLERIRKAWADQKDIRELMVFLRSHGIAAGLATRIFKHYGKASLAVVKEDPYRLAMEVSGIGFISADKIAQNLGFSPDSPKRAEAALCYVLHQGTEEGHVCLPKQVLIEKCHTLLKILPELLNEALDRLALSRVIKKEDLKDRFPEHSEYTELVYLRGYYIAEAQVAARLRYLSSRPKFHKPIDPAAAIDWLQNRLPIRLAPLQQEAVKQALTEKVLIITGGPGTGKTTLIRAILTIYKHSGAKVCLAAPTGRAAKRLNETTGHPASTIHRLLEFSPQVGGFQRNEQKPLSTDMLIIDEASMLDILLLHHILKAVPSQASLILVGDSDQLPSVGPGNVLADIIEAGRFSVIHLSEIFRQARQSRIVVNAHLVREGRMPLLRTSGNSMEDFYFIEKEDPDEIVDVIVRLCSQRIPARFRFDPVEDIQVLSPMNKGPLGTQRLNSVLQAALNPHRTSLSRGGTLFRVQDKVMQIRNNYDKDVFNGDIGRITKIDMDNQEVLINMDGRMVVYDFTELDELVLAYAISVHKAQGSEYPAVVVPVISQQYIMLQRNLLYTALTRARKLAVLVGTKKALALAVRNNKMQYRYSLLRDRLREGPTGFGLIFKAGSDHDFSTSRRLSSTH